MEPDVGLRSQVSEIRTWPKGRCLTDWATQVQPHSFIFLFLLQCCTVWLVASVSGREGDDPLPCSSNKFAFAALTGEGPGFLKMSRMIQWHPKGSGYHCSHCASTTSPTDSLMMAATSKSSAEDCCLGMLFLWCWTSFPLAASTARIRT